MLSLLTALRSYGDYHAPSNPQVITVVERVTETFEQALHRRAAELKREFRLTDREHDVLIHLARGHSAEHIGKALFISTSTTQGYIKKLYVKLGVNRKQQVIDLFQV